MGLWDGLVKRGITGEVRKEDIHKAYAEIEVGPAKKYSGFWIGNKEYKMSKDVWMSVRFHDVYINLKDERFKHWCRWKPFIITRIGDTGLQTVQEMVDNVVKKYGDFDGYTCEEDNNETYKCRTEKTNKMIAEIEHMLDEHNLKMGGFPEAVI